MVDFKIYVVAIMTVLLNLFFTEETLIINLIKQTLNLPLIYLYISQLLSFSSKNIYIKVKNKSKKLNLKKYLYNSLLPCKHISMYRSAVHFFGTAVLLTDMTSSLKLPWQTSEEKNLQFAFQYH